MALGHSRRASALKTVCLVCLHWKESAAAARPNFGEIQHNLEAGQTFDRAVLPDEPQEARKTFFFGGQGGALYCSIPVETRLGTQIQRKVQKDLHRLGSRLL
ncbi:hypothetical protein BCV70DRAFT_114678 [Testicularia cyperi]|uniref:F-box domain-containing protein n=1 Tax=Testicularia cyperi TaxID=1882483 RepID=A0A317XER0_9BASI|nr:hypothetical protein BCV70DRAFT_114678 [Testicularia cyperi]